MSKNYELSENNDLVYTMHNKKINLSSFYDKDIQFFNSDFCEQYDNPTIDYYYQKGLIHLTIMGENLNIFTKGISFELDKQDVKGIFYSFEHIQAIINKYDYKYPIFKNIEKKIELTLNNIKNNPFINFPLFVCERDNPSQLIEIYTKMKSTYNESNIFKKIINLEILSQNYEKYLKIEADNKDIPLFMSLPRFAFFSNVYKFLENKEKIYAICGPFGIGKSFTALLLQKELFLKNFSSIYINLANNEDIKSLKMTIIKELFFLGLEQTEFVSESQIILNEQCNDIWDIINKIDNYCLIKNIKYLLILDQYHKDKDKNNFLSNLKTNKILLLSSINDEDVKDSLFPQEEKKDKLTFKYIYLKDFEMDDLIKDYLKENSDNNVNECLMMFNYFPIYFFLMSRKFNWSILDFLNFQFWSVLNDLSKFYQKHSIKYISYLKNNKRILEKTSTYEIYENKNDFIKNIKDISLKYISYEITGEKAKLFYSFDYVKFPLDLEIKYNLSIERINANFGKIIKGGDFENILKYKFIIDKNSLNIDSFIYVNKIINMDLEGKYKLINKNDLIKKKCIFISQTDETGEDYDYALIYPESKEIILLQAKYKLTINNVQNVTYFSDNLKTGVIINICRKKLGIVIDKISILYISCFEFNNKSCFRILNNKKVNCLFYKIKENTFTTNFKSIYFDIKSLATQVYPDVPEYVSQYYEKRKKFDEILLPLIKINQEKIKKNEIKLSDLGQEYNDFKEYLQEKDIDDNLKNHLGKFYTKISQEEFIYPKLYFDFYLLFFQINSNKKIDYKKEIILVYEDNNTICYYNITNDKKDDKLSIKDLIKKYSYIIGFWKDDIVDIDDDI